MINGRAEPSPSRSPKPKPLPKPALVVRAKWREKKRQVGMLTDADERMKWNGMSARLAEAGSKTSQSAKTSAEPNRERENERE